MSRIITAIAVVVALIATGISLSLYAKLHPAPQKLAKVEPAPPRNLATPVKQPSKQSPEEEARNAKSLAVIRASVDEFLTGDPNGRAEWKAPNGVDFPTICGVTPQGRYFVRRNRYGQARYDEPATETSSDFTNIWASLGCQKTSPMNQQYLIHDQIQDDHYKATHEINSECLMAEIHADSTNDQAAMKRFDSDPRYCRNGHYERDQAAKTQSAAMNDVRAVAK